MKSMLWMSAALGAAFFYAMSNSISAKISVQEGFKAQFYQVPGLLTSCVIYFVYKIFKALEFGKQWNSWITETYYIEVTETSKKSDQPIKKWVLNKQIIKAVVICGVSDWIDNFLFILAYDYSFKAGINFSVIVSMFALLPIIISIAFYCNFGEKIQRNHIFAMIVAMISVLLITFSKEDIFLGGSSSDKYELHPIWAVILMISVLLCTTFRLMVMKKFWTVKGQERDSMVLSFTWSFIMNLCLLVFATFNYDYLKDGNSTFKDDLIYSYFGGVAGGAADGLGSYASTVGIGGVATMLTGTCTFFQTIIEYFFFEAIYSTLDYAILIFAFIAVILSAMHE